VGRAPVAEGALTLRRAVAAAAAALVVAAEIAAPAGSTWLSLLDAAVGVAFALGAAAAARTAPALCLLALVVAATWSLGTVEGRAVAVLVHRAPLALLLLLYPGRLPRGLVARMVAVVAVLAPLAGAAPSAAALGAVAVVVVARAMRAPSMLRTPLAAAACAAVAIAGAAGAGAAGLADATAVLVVYDAVLLAAALCLLGPLATGRWSAAAASGLVVELAAGPAGAPVTAGLADVLHDPALRLLVRAPGGSWTDEAGQAAPDPAAALHGRALTRRVLPDGTEVAVVHAPAAITDRSVAEAAVAVAATAVDNARREREVRARIEELRRLRRSLVDAADEERRQLEDDLRLGPLREADRLDELLAALPAERGTALREELAIARSELSAIAQGLYPEALARAGLAGALADAAARSPLPVAVHAQLDGQTPRAPIALTAYFVAIEALANVAKHARAARARLELSVGGGELLVRVVDDGIGGADAAGGGLSGLRDRVAAIGGDLRVVSPPGGGTVIEARLPL
jgi:signal transduction histidine kinase